jgi:glycosyltransferase involved in cell wall biosynthesis
VLLSIIVPVYLKSQQFLRECIESILAQTLRDFELILINDASPDRSLDTIKSHANKDRRIKIINLKHNSGVAVARNLGISFAQGKYISFIDSDDIAAPDYFETLVKVAEYFELDIAVAGVTNFQKTHQLKPIKSSNLNKIFQLKAVPFRTPSVQHFVCRIFLRSTLQNLRFDEKLHSGEDILFIHQAMMASKKCAEINHKGYCYRHPPKSELEAYEQQFRSTKKKDSEKLSQRIEEALHLVQQLCALRNFTQNDSDIQFVRYFSIRRFFRYSNLIRKFPAYEDRIFYWQKFRETFEKQIQLQLFHCLLNPLLRLIFKHKKPFHGIGMSIYLIRMLWEIYHIKQNIRRILKPLKLYFKGISC